MLKIHRYIALRDAGELGLGDSDTAIMEEHENGNWVELADLKPYLKDILTCPVYSPVWKASAKLLRELIEPISEYTDTIYPEDWSGPSLNDEGAK